MNEFIQKVYLMRQAQKDFFLARKRKQHTRANELLELCKQLEKEIDMEIEKLKIKN